MVDLTPLWFSIQVAAAATLGSLVIGTAVAYALARGRFRGRDALEAVFTLPLVLPPTVLGYYLLALFGRRSALGAFLERSLGITIVFTPLGAVLASLVVGIPLVVRTARVAFESVDRDLERAGRTLGFSELAVFCRITLPLAWRGIVAGTVLAFTRGLGEFGATLLVAGNIPGRTQTIATAIYNATQTGNSALANTLVAITTVLAFAVLLVVARLTR
ncbi:MAG: molybdate ABC transporter permease subunit [Deinococcus sp.]|nr:molybdate ABC transporter permease subunit [Deinococcus sp.]